jgi:hypothetical protein
MWTIDERMRLAYPEFVHRSPVIHDDSTLITKDTLVHRRADLLGPSREDS